MVIRELWNHGTNMLKNSETESPRADAGLLLMSAAKISKTQLIIGDFEVFPTVEQVFLSFIERRLSGEPVQYITGKCKFMSYEFFVTKDVLIPRPETELLVEYILNHCEKNRKYNILDIGTGNGCIAVSLCAGLENSFVSALDISDKALETARKNAVNMKVADRMAFIRHDIMNGFIDLEFEFDIIVSNPPYIPNADVATLEKNVKDFEPRLALAGGADGLNFYRQIIKCAKLKTDGLIGFEVGINQAQAVAQLLASNGTYTDIKIEKDFSEIERMVFARKTCIL